MSAQTLNVIYDTNYTNIINGGGFVNNNFSNSDIKKGGFFGSLFGNSNSSNQQNTTSTQTQNSQQGDKAPGFFDLLFGPLNSNTAANMSKSKTQQTNNSDTTSQKTEGEKSVEGNIEAATQNHEIAQAQQSSKEAEDAETKS